MGSRSCWITLCDLSGPLEYLVLASRVYRHWRFGCFTVERKSIDGFGAQWVLFGNGRVRILAMAIRGRTGITSKNWKLAGQSTSRRVLHNYCTVA